MSGQEAGKSPSYTDAEKSSSDVEKSPLSHVSVLPSVEPIHSSWTQRLLKWGVETRGISPVPLEERTDEQYSKMFTLWFTMNFNVLSFSAGILGPVAYGLSLKASCLVILFFNILCVIPPAYFSQWGSKLGLRQMVQARYSFGYFGVTLPVIFNLIGMVGFCITNSILGGQALASVANYNLSWSVGVVIVSIISLFISFFGYRVLHYYERFAWIPILVAYLTAVGTGGHHLKHPVPPAVPDTAPAVLSFASVIAGFTVTWMTMSSDFTVYFRDRVPWRISAYVYAGLFLPTTCVQLLGAAVGAAMGNVDSWATGYENGSVGGVLEAMLQPAGGFGKFLTVLLALSVMGNIAATFYSISLNLQIVLPFLVVVPRYVFSIVITAIVIPLGITGAHSFVATLSDLLGLIGYWATPFIAILLEEHFIFRGGDFANYDISEWNQPSKLPWGISAVLALCCGFGVAIPSMDQIWYVGPIAEHTGDIGFELAFVAGAIAYPPLKFLENKIRASLSS